MTPELEKRLGQVRAGMLHNEAAICNRRTGLEAWVALGTLLRRMLEERGIDPAEVRALRFSDEAAAELATLPGPTAAQSEAGAPAEADGAAHEQLLHRLARLAAANSADGRRPDPERSPPAEWLAWCLFTPAAHNNEASDTPSHRTFSPSMEEGSRE